MSLVEEVDKRLERMERYAEKIETAFTKMQLEMSNGSLEEFTQQDIRLHLSHDPDMIAEAGVLAAKIRRDYEYAKLDKNTIFAELKREAITKKDELGLTSAEDRKSWVESQPRYKEAAEMEITWQYRVELSKVILKRYDDMFVGVRKLCSLLEKDDMNVYRREKYGEH